MLCYVPAPDASDGALLARKRGQRVATRAGSSACALAGHQSRALGVMGQACSSCDALSMASSGDRPSEVLRQPQQQDARPPAADLAPLPSGAAAALLALTGGPLPLRTHDEMSEALVAERRACAALRQAITAQELAVALDEGGAGILAHH